MNVLSELKLLLIFVVATLLYIVFLGVLLQDWGRGIVQGVLWGIIMAMVIPKVSDWRAERRIRKSREEK